jgi:hypothetical protein
MGGLDFHRPEHFGAPVYELEVETLSKEAVLETLQKGAYKFGSKKRQVSAHGTWQGKGYLDAILSDFSITIINLGKYVNKVLFKLGLKAPKVLANSLRKHL